MYKLLWDFKRVNLASRGPQVPNYNRGLGLEPPRFFSSDCSDSTDLE